MIWQEKRRRLTAERLQASPRGPKHRCPMCLESRRWGVLNANSRRRSGIWIQPSWKLNSIRCQFNWWWKTQVKNYCHLRNVRLSTSWIEITSSESKQWNLPEMERVCYFMLTNITSFHNISFTFADQVKCADTFIQLYQTLIFVSLSQMLILIVQKLTSEELLKSGAAQGQN